MIAFCCLLAFAIWSFQSRSVTLYEESFEGGFLKGDIVKNSEELVLRGDIKGEGEWNKSIDISPGKLAWEWEGTDHGEFQFWLRFSFNNHKSLYYVADGSKNPPYEGEYYMDDEGRRRFSPASVISGIATGKVERDIKVDYGACCGSADDLKITGIAVGMASDNDKSKLKIYDIKIFN
jgi:hypothetical protein